MIIKLIKPSDQEKSWYLEDKHGKRVDGPELWTWVQSLVIPPAWKDVHLDTSPKAVRVVWGIDQRGRTQYIYSKKHVMKARQQKYCNLVAFGEALPRIRSDMAKYMASQRMTKNKIISLVLRIVDSCSFRLGTLKYEYDNDSYGITTIKREHVKFDAKGAKIHFIGKKGVENECTLTDATDIKVLKDLYESKTDDHLMTYEYEGSWHHIKHTDINRFLSFYGEEFTSKDFRTFRSNTLIIDRLRKLEHPNKLSKSKRKKQMNAAIIEVAEKIHNTKAVCQKDYIDPELLELYMEHPISYRAKFITPTVDARILFMNWLKSKCS